MVRGIRYKDLPNKKVRSSLSFIEGCLPLRVIFWQRQTDKQKNPFIGAIASAVPKKVVKVEWNQLKWDITYDRSRNIFQKYFIYILDGGGTIFLLCWNFSATELPVHLRLVCKLKFVHYGPLGKKNPDCSIYPGVIVTVRQSLRTAFLKILASI